MAGGQERVLRRRIRSVESTKKITRAMELIAASRIVKAQHAIAAARPYVEKMSEVVGHLAASPDSAGHPVFRSAGETKSVAIVAITADRGLAGGYNANVIRAVERLANEHRAASRQVRMVTVGRKATNYFRHRRADIMFSLTGKSDRPGYEDARGVVSAVVPAFEAGEVDRIDLVYTKFLSLGSQAVTVRQLVPVAPGASDHGAAGGVATAYEFEPEPTEILDRLLPSWLEAEVLAAMLESAASEHASRQRAMKAATDNADELIKTLRRIMNRARQDAITSEIMEIVGGAEALRMVPREDAGSYNEIYQPMSESA